MSELFCFNCNETVSEAQDNEHYAKLKQFSDAIEKVWCGPECYLSYVLPSLQLYARYRRRSDVSTCYDRSVRERPPRSELRNWGGHLTLDQYHKRAPVMMTRGSRVHSRPRGGRSLPAN